MKWPRPKNKVLRFFMGALLVLLSLLVGNAVALTIIALLLAGILPLTWSPVSYVIIGVVAKFVDIIIDFVITTQLLKETHPMRKLRHKKCIQKELDQDVHLGNLVMSVPYEDWAIILPKLLPDTAKYVKQQLKGFESVREFMGDGAIQFDPKTLTVLPGPPGKKWDKLVP